MIEKTITAYENLPFAPLAQANWLRLIISTGLSTFFGMSKLLAHANKPYR